MRRAGFRNWLLPSLLLFSICTASFTYGFVASQFKVFPYKVLREARAAVSALVDVSAPEEISGLASYRTHVVNPTAIRHSEMVSDGLFLISAGPKGLPSHHPDGCLAWIVDRDGDVKHYWKDHPQLWNDLETVTRVPGISGDINPAGLHLCENGDLLATFHGFNTFPFAIGMARFDRDSNLLWKKELLTHHCFSVAADGRIFVPALEVTESPVQIGRTAAMIESASGKVYRDIILVLDPDGNVLERISIADALFESGFHGQLTRGNASQVLTDDPLHLNDALLLGDAGARQLPGTEPDDLLVSLRNINTVGILDSRKRRFRWITSGTTVGQHSPRVWQNGILILDNLGGDVELGGTRLVHVDYHTGLPSTIFPRQDVPMPDLCRTANSGHLDVHPDQRTALLTLTHEGAIWEIDLQTGEVIWEYIYVDPGGDGTRRSTRSAKYVHQPAFISFEGSKDAQ